MLTLFLIIVIFLRFPTSELRRLDDICGHPHGRRFYVDLGESGVLSGYNITFNGTNIGAQQYNNMTSHEQCLVEIITCPSCVINLVFRHLNLSHNCNVGNLGIDNPCRCDYVWISEPPYEQVSGVPYCGFYQMSTSSPDGGSLSFKSKTRTVSIALIFSGFHSHAFSIDYSSERNRQFFVGSPAVSPLRDLNSSGVITSPFFPNTYSRDLVIEFVITCANETDTSIIGKIDPNCRVRLIFSDFQASPVSIMEFFDSKHQRIDVVSGASFRPPVILSSGPMLTVRFFANGGNDIGFKAMFSFISGNYIEKTIIPITDCGGFVEDFGGAITMVNMVERGINTYDCMWLIRPPENFLHLKTHLYLKVTTFKDFAGSTELQIRQGLTSELSVLETLRYPVNQISSPHGSREHIISISSGFYVSLRGSFGPASQLAITYASFSYNKCFSETEFLCKNHRCIAGKLNCDGFDHCGDNSDEPASCYQEWEIQTIDRRWNSHTPNYYFPKIERYTDLKMATLLFIVSSLGLILLISALIVLLYRMGSRARQQRDLQDRLQTISELLDETRIEEMVTSDEPPCYEAPPDYDDVMKTPSAKPRKKRRSNSQRSRSAASDRLTDIITMPSEEGLDSEPRHLLLPIQSLSVHASRASIISQSASSISQQPASLPDSPPPPYSARNKSNSIGRVASEGDIENLASTEQHVVVSSERASNSNGGCNTPSWYVIEDDNIGEPKIGAKINNSQLAFNETGLRDVNVIEAVYQRRSFKRLRRSQSCSNNPRRESISNTEGLDAKGQDHKSENLFIANHSEISSAAAQCSLLDQSKNIENLNNAIENQLQTLLKSNIHTHPNSPSVSVNNTDSETCYFSSLDSSQSFMKTKAETSQSSNYWSCSSDEKDPFNDLDYPPSRKSESGIVMDMDNDEADDTYWKEFDKQFQNPERKMPEHRQSRKKVADLSKRFNSSVTALVSEKGDIFMKKESEITGTGQEKMDGSNEYSIFHSKCEAVHVQAALPCECNGACSCASFRFKHFQPIRKKKSLSCDNMRIKDAASDVGTASCEVTMSVKTF